MSQQIPREEPARRPSSGQTVPPADKPTGAAFVRTPPRRKPVKDHDWSYAGPPRAAATERGANVGRLWKLAVLAILMPVLAMTAMRAYRQMPSVTAATDLVTGAISRELDMPTDLAHAAISITSEPTADVNVWIDGAFVGQTPIEDLAIDIGPHQIRFQHSYYGSAIREVIATRSQPLRVSVDLTQP